MIKYCILFLFLGIISTLNAQEKYSENEITNFIEIYFSEKEISKYNDSSLINIFQKHSINKEKYLELKKYKNRSVSEIQSIKDIEKDLSVYENEQEIYINDEIIKLCNKLNISINRYYEIKKDFQYNLIFHRSLKPNIDKYLKSINHE